MFKNKKTYLIPIIGFALIILIGAVLLYMPICNNKPISFRDALFTSTSGVTTSGFSKVILEKQFNIIGQIIIAILMEIGAMGFIIFISYFWIMKDRKIKMSDMMVINDSISGESYATIKTHSVFIVKYMLKIQVLGSILLSVSFVPIYGVLKGIWYSIFHTISAFSNCGFDLIGNNSLIPFKENVYIQIILSMLMILGSIGILVIEDIRNNKSKKFNRLKLQTKIVLIYTMILLIVPTICMKIVDPSISLINSFFLTASSRSTGFTIVDLGNVSQASKIILIVLMFIGGGPTSTAGGVRIVPIAVIIATILSTLKGKNETIIFWRKIPESNVRRAFTILILFLLILTLIGMIMSSYHNLSVLEIVFNNVSAISNTGLSLYDINELNLIQEICVLILMFIGRIGILSLILVFFHEDKKDKFIKHPIENVIL